MSVGGHSFHINKQSGRNVVKKVLVFFWAILFISLASTTKAEVVEGTVISLGGALIKKSFSTCSALETGSSGCFLEIENATTGDIILGWGASSLCLNGSPGMNVRMNLTTECQVLVEGEQDTIPVIFSTLYSGGSVLKGGLQIEGPLVVRGSFRVTTSK